MFQGAYYIPAGLKWIETTCMSKPKESHCNEHSILKPQDFIVLMNFPWDEMEEKVRMRKDSSIVHFKSFFLYFSLVLLLNKIFGELHVKPISVISNFYLFLSNWKYYILTLCWFNFLYPLNTHLIRLTIEKPSLALITYYAYIQTRSHIIALNTYS